MELEIYNTGLIKKGGEESQKKDSWIEKSNDGDIKIIGRNKFSDNEKKFTSCLLVIKSSSTLL